MIKRFKQLLASSLPDSGKNDKDHIFESYEIGGSSYLHHGLSATGGAALAKISAPDASTMGW